MLQHHGWRMGEAARARHSAAQSVPQSTSARHSPRPACPSNRELRTSMIAHEHPSRQLSLPSPSPNAPRTPSLQAQTPAATDALTDSAASQALQTGLRDSEVGRPGGLPRQGNPCGGGGRRHCDRSARPTGKSPSPTNRVSGKYRVDTDGSITFPYLQRVPLAGLTLADAQTKMHSSAGGY